MNGVKKLWNRIPGRSRLVSQLGLLWTKWVLWLSRLPGFPNTIRQITVDDPEFYPYQVVIPGSIFKRNSSGQVFYGLSKKTDILNWIAIYIEEHYPDSHKKEIHVALRDELDRRTFGINYRFGFMDPDLAMAFRFTWSDK